jgi:hypothetical protein
MWYMVYVNNVVDDTSKSEKEHLIRWLCCGAVANGYRAENT